MSYKTEIGKLQEGDYVSLLHNNETLGGEIVKIEKYTIPPILKYDIGTEMVKIRISFSDFVFKASKIVEVWK